MIRRMLENMLAVLDHDDYRVYVGCYCNDPATIAEVQAIADDRLRLVVGPVAGPTTKGDCLNRLWLKMIADETAEATKFKAVVLHDAEDVVHADELKLFDSLIERFDFVQLPVIPLIDPASRWVGGHYADEFAQAHGREMPVRGRIGAALPSAGVGCAFSRALLGRLAGPAGPFGADSLTEDYELGLRISDGGGSAAFVRIDAAAGAGPVATRAFFPADVSAAVIQKARWTLGIALSGWDRMGWSGGWAERWMRLRDRQSPLAALLLVAGYGSLLLWLALAAGRAAAGVAQVPMPPLLAALAAINMALVAWRLLLRAGFTASAYGWREGLRAVPRAAVGNWIAVAAAAAALRRYRQARRTGRTRWEKTAHVFPGGE